MHFVVDQEKWARLSECCVALSKPGTVTLELALMKVPTVIAYKTSRLTYWIARLVVKVPFMGLPNLFLGRHIFPEHIQTTCKPVILAKELERMMSLCVVRGQEYQVLLEQLDELKQSFDVNL